MSNTTKFISLDNLQQIWTKIRATFALKAQVKVLEDRVARLEEVIRNMNIS